MTKELELPQPDDDNSNIASTSLYRMGPFMNVFARQGMARYAKNICKQSPLNTSNTNKIAFLIESINKPTVEMLQRPARIGELRRRTTSDQGRKETSRCAQSLFQHRNNHVTQMILFIPRAACHTLKMIEEIGKRRK